MGPSTLTLASESPEQLPPSISPQQQKKLTHPSTTLKLFPQSTTVQAIQSQYTKPVLPTRSKQPPKRTHSSSLSKSPLAYKNLISAVSPLSSTFILKQPFLQNRRFRVYTTTTAEERQERLPGKRAVLNGIT